MPFGAYPLAFGIIAQLDPIETYLWIKDTRVHPTLAGCIPAYGKLIFVVVDIWLEVGLTVVSITFSNRPICSEQVNSPNCHCRTADHSAARPVLLSSLYSLARRGQMCEFVESRAQAPKVDRRC